MIRYATYDRATGTILRTGMAGSLASALRDETAENGIMECPLGVTDLTHKIIRRDDGTPELQPKEQS